MQLHSSAFEEGGMIPSKYTCDGDNSSPPLSISGLPTGAKTLALVLEDPDAPNGTWVHWTLWNLPTETSSLPEGSIPSSAVEGVTSFGKPGYGGPCPPDGTHHYIFTLYALDTALSITSYTDRAGLGTAMQGHVLAQATLTGLYAKQ
jgi:Raf kinase inhibitor-like YbhB/YbcL family protein